MLGGTVPGGLAATAPVVGRFTADGAGMADNGTSDVGHYSWIGGNRQ